MELEKLLQKMRSTPDEIIDVKDSEGKSNKRHKLRYELGIGDNLQILLNTNYADLIKHLKGTLGGYNTDEYTSKGIKETIMENGPRLDHNSKVIKIHDGRRLMYRRMFENDPEKFIEKYNVTMSLHPGGGMKETIRIIPMIEEVVHYAKKTNSPFCILSIPENKPTIKHTDTTAWKEFFGFYEPKNTEM